MSSPRPERRREHRPLATERESQRAGVRAAQRVCSCLRRAVGTSRPPRRGDAAQQLFPMLSARRRGSRLGRGGRCRGPIPPDDHVVRGRPCCLFDARECERERHVSPVPACVAKPPDIFVLLWQPTGQHSTQKARQTGEDLGRGADFAMGCLRDEDGLDFVSESIGDGAAVLVRQPHDDSVGVGGQGLSEAGWTLVAHGDTRLGGAGTRDQTVGGRVSSTPNPLDRPSLAGRSLGQDRREQRATSSLVGL